MFFFAFFTSIVYLSCVVTSLYTCTCDSRSAAPVTYCCFYHYCDSQWFIYCYDFLLTSIHFIHLFSILLPVCFNKFSVQCSVFFILDAFGVSITLPWAVRFSTLSASRSPCLQRLTSLLIWIPAIMNHSSWIEPQVETVSSYGWLMTHYGWLAGLNRLAVVSTAAA